MTDFVVLSLVYKPYGHVSLKIHNYGSPRASSELTRLLLYDGILNKICSVKEDVSERSQVSTMDLICETKHPYISHSSPLSNQRITMC